LPKIPENNAALLIGWLLDRGVVRATLVAVAAGISLGKAGVVGVAQVWFDGG
jgi:hypothetical protein